MMKNISKIMTVAALLAGVLFLQCHPVWAVPQGTKGDELQLMQAQQLEIHLGREWSGTAFSLQTDAGTYPGIVTVDPQGVLRMEIGGSSKYILARMKTGDAVSSVPVESENVADKQQERTTDSETEEECPPAAEADPDSATGLPALPLALFGGGMTAAIGTLIWVSASKKRQCRGASESDDDL